MRNSNWRDIECYFREHLYPCVSVITERKNVSKEQFLNVRTTSLSQNVVLRPDLNRAAHLNVTYSLQHR